MEAYDIFNAYTLSGTYFLVQSGSNHLGFIIFIDEESHKLGVQFAYILEYPKPSDSGWVLIPVPSANHFAPTVIQNMESYEATNSYRSALNYELEETHIQYKRKLEGFYSDLAQWIADGSIPWIAYPHWEPKVPEGNTLELLKNYGGIRPNLFSQELEIWAPTHNSQDCIKNGKGIGFISMRITYWNNEIVSAQLETVEPECPGQLFRRVYRS
jgi:hypothetical protein